MRFATRIGGFTAMALWAVSAFSYLQCDAEYPGVAPPWPAPPEPEPIEVVELPLPPVAPTSDTGACTSTVNPRGTGCIGQSTYLFSGDFLPDGNHVVASVVFAGAPAAPDPASIYTGTQLIIVKTDNTTFPSGDAWKCITCGIPEANAIGFSSSSRPGSASLDYPQAFGDGSRLMAGTQVISCGDHQLTSEDCVPEETFVYPIRWQNNANDTGAGGSFRELRLHPDSVHLGFNSFAVTADGKLSQFAYFSRLSFNPSPSTGTPPLGPRYDLINVTRLFNEKATNPIEHRDGELFLHADAVTVGELRGFSGTGGEVTYLGSDVESCNIDVFAADLATGAVRRLTAHPEYVDPMHVSPDDAWTVVMDTRGSGRQMFLSGLRGVPPLTDLLTTTVCASTRNNGQRRFFQPWLIDRHGDRGCYFGQQVNAEGSGVPGSGDVNDPEWNGMADPRFSPDGTRIVYWQALTVPPACGGDNPLPCYNSTEPGGRTARMMLAKLTSRQPFVRNGTVPEASDVIPWGTPYDAGESSTPERLSLPGGIYTLRAKVNGSAEVVVTENAAQTGLQSIAVTYHDYSDDGVNVLRGTENVTASAPSMTLSQVDWFSNLERIGPTSRSTKITSPDGFHIVIDVLTNIFDANGTMTTTVDGVVYEQPLNGA